MARTTDRPSAAIRPKTARAPLDTDGSGTFDGPNQRGEGGQPDDAGRRENLTAVRNGQGNERDESRDNRDDSRENRDDSRENRDDSRENRDERGNRNRRDDREVGENRDERMLRDGDTEQDSRRGHRPATSASLDAFAPVLEVWKQVFKSWSELTDTMVKAQQDAFASMIGAANTTAKNIKGSEVGERRNSGPAFSGSRTTASRTTASTPDRVEHDRR